MLVKQADTLPWNRWSGDQRQFLRWCLQSAQNGGSIRGIAFWEWFQQGQVGPAAEGYGDGLYGISTSDAVFGTIRSNAQVPPRSRFASHLTFCCWQSARMQMHVKSQS